MGPRVVLDTNVLVAGLLSPFGPCAQIIRMVSSGDLTLCLDARILSEYDEVLHRAKFRFQADRVAALLDHIECRGCIAASSPLPDRLPDPDDQAFLEVAVAGRVACLVTGNQAHFPVEKCRPVKVLSPSKFLASLKSRNRRKGP